MDCGKTAWEEGEEAGRVVAENIHKNKETVLFPLINYVIMCT